MSCLEIFRTSLALFGNRDKLTQRSSELTIDEIEVQNLSYTYLAGNILHAAGTLRRFDDCSQRISTRYYRGDRIGKIESFTTFERLYLPQSGRVKVGPFNLNSMNFDLRALRHYAGLVFQNPESYFFKQYVGDEIAYGPKLFYGTENLRERVKWAMNFVELDFETLKIELPPL
jgi:energy-coupling factor transport system ATP-binding protein